MRQAGMAEKDLQQKSDSKAGCGRGGKGTALDHSVFDRKKYGFQPPGDI